MTRERFVRVLVTTTVAYLTDNGEETEESGWDVIETHLIDHLRFGFNQYQNPARPSAKFIEWEE